MSLRILVANQEAASAGGVHTYLSAVMPALRARGHEVAFLFHDDLGTGSGPLPQPSFGVRALGFAETMTRVDRWRPDVCFSHNMQALDVDAALAERWPVVKMMHGYFGTCISGQKAWLWPSGVPCHRRFDAACLGYYFPRRCGEASPAKMLRHYSWAARQKSMFGGYAAIVVASAHMRAEYERNGAPAGKIHRVPLFAPQPPPGTHVRRDRHVLFLGRMTDLKGGDLLVRAAALLASEGSRVRLTMAGDGSARPAWHALASRLRVAATFPGWIDRQACGDLLSDASVLCMPSVWPEPFGLVGLEAAASGVPSVAFDGGGVREWLEDGVSGLLAGDRPDPRSLARALGAVLFDDALRERLARGARAVAERLTLARHVDTLIDTVLRPAALGEVRAGSGTPAGVAL